MLPSWNSYDFVISGFPFSLLYHNYSSMMHVGQLTYQGISSLAVKRAFPNICYKDGVLIEGGVSLGGMISEVSDLLLLQHWKTRRRQRVRLVRKLRIILWVKGRVAHDACLDGRLGVLETQSTDCLPNASHDAQHTVSCCCSVTESCPTLCDPVDCDTPGFPVLLYHSGFAQTHAHWVSDVIQPFHLLPTASPPALSLSQHQGLFQCVGPLHQVAKVLELQLQHQSFQWIFRTDFL